MGVTSLFILIAIASIVAYDVWAWRQVDVPTITQVTREFVRAHGFATMAIAIAIGYVLGHLFWCAC